jgi:uncharacterized protein YrrD
MRLGNELIGRPIYSLTDGRFVGTARDLYIDLELGVLKGIFLGNEGVFKRRALLIPRHSIAILGLDAILVTGPDVVSKSTDYPEVETWLRREQFQGRDITTPGGTKVGTVGDILINEEAKIVGYSLARVHVEGPIAEKRLVMNEAVVDPGGREGIMTIDLAIAERSPAEPIPAEEPEKLTEPEALSEPAPAPEEPEIDEILEETEDE